MKDVIDSGFAEYAKERDAESLPELVEAAASYMTHVEGRDGFARTELMRKIDVVDIISNDYTEGLAAFGKLLREGKIAKVNRNRFSATDNIGFKPDDSKPVGKGIAEKIMSETPELDWAPRPEANEVIDSIPEGADQSPRRAALDYLRTAVAAAKQAEETPPVDHAAAVAASAQRARKAVDSVEQEEVSTFDPEQPVLPSRPALRGFRKERAKVQPNKMQNEPPLKLVPTGVLDDNDGGIDSPKNRGARVAAIIADTSGPTNSKITKSEPMVEAVIPQNPYGRKVIEAEPGRPLKDIAKYAGAKSMAGLETVRKGLVGIAADTLGTGTKLKLDEILEKRKAKKAKNAQLKAMSKDERAKKAEQEKIQAQYDEVMKYKNPSVYIAQRRVRTLPFLPSIPVGAWNNLRLRFMRDDDKKVNYISRKIGEGAAWAYADKKGLDVSFDAKNKKSSVKESVKDAVSSKTTKTNMSMEDFQAQIDAYKKTPPLSRWAKRVLGANKGFSLDSSLDAKSNGRLVRDELGSEEKFYAYQVALGKISAEDAYKLLPQTAVKETPKPAKANDEATSNNKEMMFTQNSDDPNKLDVLGKDDNGQWIMDTVSKDDVIYDGDNPIGLKSENSATKHNGIVGDDQGITLSDPFAEKSPDGVCAEAASTNTGGSCPVGIDVSEKHDQAVPKMESDVTPVQATDVESVNTTIDMPHKSDKENMALMSAGAEAAQTIAPLDNVKTVEKTQPAEVGGSEAPSATGERAKSKTARVVERAKETADTLNTQDTGIVNDPQIREVPESELVAQPQQSNEEMREAVKEKLTELTATSEKISDVEREGGIVFKHLDTSKPNPLANLVQDTVVHEDLSERVEVKKTEEISPTKSEKIDFWAHKNVHQAMRHMKAPKPSQ